LLLFSSYYFQHNFYSHLQFPKKVNIKFCEQLIIKYFRWDNRPVAPLQHCFFVLTYKCLQSNHNNRNGGATE
jgi:hypothetical protein